jgi:hypothetical protein
MFSALPSVSALPPVFITFPGLLRAVDMIVTNPSIGCTRLCLLNANAMQRCGRV